jgi:16S rRNA (cytosine1402-N4)-methyltransferase
MNWLNWESNGSRTATPARERRDRIRETKEKGTNGMPPGLLMVEEIKTAGDWKPHHEPVMLGSVLQFMCCRAGGFYVDGTCGLGGHSAAILDASSPDGRLLAIDRDQAAIGICREKLAGFGDRVRLIQDNFKNLPLILNNLNIKEIDGILLDLGVSSLQLEDEERGFAFMADGPLDMRMDQRQKLTAGDLVNSLGEKELADLIFQFGEEPASRRIARAIVYERAKSLIRTTGQLAQIVERAAFRKGDDFHARRHLATRTFQALRIAVNDELRDLDVLAHDLASYLAPGGRLVIISFHSLEDRLIKTAFKRLAGRCVCGLPSALCRCERKAMARIVTSRPVTPAFEEVQRNPRGRSAHLRCIERL